MVYYCNPGDKVVVTWPLVPDEIDHLIVTAPMVFYDVPASLEGTVTSFVKHNKYAVYNVRFEGHPKLERWSCRDSWVQPAGGPW